MKHYTEPELIELFEKLVEAGLGEETELNNLTIGELDSLVNGEPN